MTDEIEKKIRNFVEHYQKKKSSKLLWSSKFAFIFEAIFGIEEGVWRATRPMKGQKER